MNDENENRRKEAEKEAFKLVASQNGVNFGEDEFKKFKALWPSVAKEMRADLLVQFLEKLEFSQKAHEIPKGKSGVETGSIEQDFLMRAILNQSADICNLSFDNFNTLRELVSYLQTTLKNVFINKLKKIPLTLDLHNPETDEDSPTFEISVEDDGELKSELLLSEHKGLQERIRDFLNNCLSSYPDGKERAALLYARAVEEKKFKDIAQEFNERYGTNLTPDAYRKKFTTVVQDLRGSTLLKSLKEEIDRLNDQMIKFSVQFKKPSDRLAQLKKNADKLKKQIDKFNDQGLKQSARITQLKKDADQLEEQIDKFDDQVPNPSEKLLDLEIAVDRLKDQIVQFAASQS